MSDDINTWLQNAAAYLVTAWGLDTAFASSAALLYLYLSVYGLSPKITSGWRSPEKQQELMNRYLRGDPSVVAKPALKSLHLNTRLGNPASLAIDISTSDPELAARIATALKIRAGYYFTKPDPVHFDTGR